MLILWGDKIMGGLEDRAYDPDGFSKCPWDNEYASSNLTLFQEIVLGVGSLIAVPFGFAGVGYIAGLILGFMNESDVSKIDTYAEVGGYIGAGFGIFTAGLIAEETFFGKKHENDGSDERYWETHSSLKEENTLEYALKRAVGLEKCLSAGQDGRESAKSELNHLYANAGWFSARYAAGRALGRSKKELDTNLDFWLYRLQQGLKTTKKVTKRVHAGAEPKEAWPCKWGDANRGGPETIYEDVYESTPSDAPDTEKRLNCVSDLGMLLKLSKSRKVKKCLRKAYLRNDSPPVRRRAGKALGYSKIRIAAQEYPAMSGIASLTAIGIAAYNLLPYFMQK
jgi:hypothetical protein